MPTHHFTTPRVVYLGSAHGEKVARDARAGARSRPSGSRPEQDRARRRPHAGPAAPVR